MKKLFLGSMIGVFAFVMTATAAFAVQPEDPGCFGGVMSDKAQQKDFTVGGVQYKNWGQRMSDVAQGENIGQPERVGNGASAWVKDVKLDKCGIGE